MKFEIVNKDTVGPFTIGDNVTKYLELYPYSESKGETDWLLYEFFDNSIEVYTSQLGIIEAIGCNSSCCFNGKTLIGIDTLVFFNIIGIAIESASKDEVWMSDAEKQAVYEIESWGWQIWVNASNEVVYIFIG